MSVNKIKKLKHPNDVKQTSCITHGTDKTSGSKLVAVDNDYTISQALSHIRRGKTQAGDYRIS